MLTSTAPAPILAYLDPHTFWKVPHPTLKSGLPSDGSAQLALRRARRHPEYSRPYQPGDPIGAIDWRAYAKFEELIVREQREYSRTSHLFLIDLSASMGWCLQSTDMLWRTKANLALRIALHLAAKFNAEGDPVYFCLVDSLQVGDNFNPVAHPINRHESIRIFEHSKHLPNPYEQAQQFLSGQRGVPLSTWKWKKIVLLSDLLSIHAQITPSIQHLGALSEQTYLLHTLSQQELHPDSLQPQQIYQDPPEDHALRKRYSGRDLQQKSFLRNKINQWRQEIIDICGKHKVHYNILHDSMPISEYLLKIKHLYG